MNDREYWLQSAKTLITGVFSNIKNFEDSVVMPRLETVVTYPHDYSDPLETTKELFEGLTRSFFIAAPLINENPEIEVNGICLRDYYKAHILYSVTRGDSRCVGWYSDLRALHPERHFSPLQQTVETCALVICLWETKEVIWDSYTKEEKGLIADFLFEYAYGDTVPQNWRLFNMLDLAFLDLAGYEINIAVMKEHAAAIAGYYAGDGWYRDGQSFDYYSVWAFNVYTPIWNVMYGYEKMPETAKEFENHSNELMKHYGTFFARDGHMNMWGRSCIYRFAATSAFPANMLLENHGTDYGFYRHICTGALKQFMERDDFIGSNWIPTIGFYRQFSPLVQGYSCAESVFWLGKAFTCLHLPADHPFWTEPESNGLWAGSEPLVHTYDGPGLCTTNFVATGETTLRSGKVSKNKKDIHGIYNYGKLCYNTSFPWEACDFSQNYILSDAPSFTDRHTNLTLWHGEKDGVLYRQQFFDYDLEGEWHWFQAIRLADFAVDAGIIRVDRTRFIRRPFDLKLGAFGFPDNGTEVKRFHSEVGGRKCHAVLLKGKDSQGTPKQMAFTVYEGFSDIELWEGYDTNPDSLKSIVPYAVLHEDKHNHYQQQAVISQVITKDDLSDFTEDEIFPIAEIIYEDEERQGGFGAIEIKLKNGRKVTVDFAGIDGKLML